MKSFGPEHPRVANSLMNLGRLYRKQEKYAEAESLYQRALAMLEKALGPDDLTVATCVSNIALLYVFQGRLTDAKPLFKRTLEIREKRLGPAHPLAVTAREAYERDWAKDPL